MSDRLRLARSAAAAIAATPELTGLRGTGRWVTSDPRGAGLLDGVLAVRTGEGAVELDLHVAVAWPADRIVDTAERLRAAVRTEAERSGGTGPLGRIQVHVHDVVAPDAGAHAVAPRSTALDDPEAST